jgi:hypothetical protein
MTDEIEPVNPSDLMLRILEQIREELRSTRVELSTRLDQTNARLDQTRVELSTRLDQTNARLGQTNARLGAVEGTLVELATQQRATVTYLREHVAGDMADLRRRVQVLEARGG